jgi:Raf kinase inhibitor-like YbhB/YbcL family protein
MFRIFSPAFTDGGPIPRAHTCDGADLSPPLAWNDVPDGTRELALIVDDPDAPNGTWVHWVLYGLAPAVSGLPAGVPRDAVLKSPSGAKQGITDFRRPGWGGPCPPPGPAHRYFFTLYALSRESRVPPGATSTVLLESVKAITLAEARLMGKYSRAGKT